MRKKIVSGNWKMNMLPQDTTEMINKLIPLVKDTKTEVMLCVPYIDINNAVLAAEGTNIKIGAQNMFYEDSGAYTGEISPKMLKSAKIDNVILGHSERRKYFHETDEDINKKVKKALETEINPIVCVGETLEERENGKAKDVVKSQVTKDLEGLSAKNLDNVTIAYEPVWAIGTGKTASKEDAEEICKFIRETINEEFGTDDITILYGGSVKDTNAKEIFSMPNIDGGLIGGASLDAEKFSKIVKAD